MKTGSKQVYTQIYEKDWVSIPVGFELNGFIEKCPPEYHFNKKYGKFNHDIALIILSKLLDNKKNLNEIGESFITFRITKISHDHYNYKAYFNWFEKCNLIKVDNSYQSGRFSKKYYITNKMLLNKRVRICLQSKKSIKSFAHSANKQVPKRFFLENIHLFEGFGQLCFDEINARVYLNSLGYCESDINAMINCAKDAIKNPRYKRDKFGGRIYSSMTIVKSILRPFFRYGDEVLVEIDIKCCQPFLLGLLYYYNGIENLKHKLTGGEGELIMFEKKRAIVSEYLEAVNGDIYSMLDDFVKQNFGEDHYKSCMSIYKSKLMSIYDIVLEESKGINPNKRDMSKKLLISHINGELNHRKEVKGFFESYFPELGQYIIDSKIGESHNHYKKTARDLQSIEAFLVLECITKEFNQLYPDAFLITIHDCVVTQEKYKNNLIEAFRKCFLKLFDVPPIFKEKKWIVKE